jgi:peptidoglycan/xylan/chitin deacetylase (PgdA/CDA1 family)
MEFLRDQYRVLGLSEVIHRIENRLPLPDRTACLTFDDGFMSVYTHAWPILSRYQLPATAFVVTSLPDTGMPAWPGRILYALANTTLSSAQLDGVEWKLSKDREGAAIYGRIVDRIKTLPREEREQRVEELVAALSDGRPPDPLGSPRASMSWTEVEQLAATGLVDIESHTHTHPSLSRCPPDEQFGELKLSLDILRQRLRVKGLFCYPFGEYASTTVKMLPGLGYRCGLTTAPGLNPAQGDLYRLRRVGIGPGMTGARFEMAMIGCYR